MRNFLVGAGIALAALIPSAHANLLVNGSFEADDASASPFYLAVTPSGWAAIGDSVDIIHNNYTQGPAVLVDAQDGVQFLDLNQQGNLGGVLQIVAVIPGERYRLSLWSTAWATNGGPGSIAFSLFDPSIAILASGTANVVVGEPWKEYTLEAIAPASGQMGVQIYATAAFQAAPGLDNVDLDIVGAASVPEPGTMALLATGALAVLAVRRRKR